MARKRSNNEGSLYQSGGFWTAQISLPDGTRKKKRSKKQSVVREWLESQKEAVRGGVWVNSGTVKLSDFTNRYLEEVAAHTLRDSSYLNYRHQLKNLVNPRIGDIKINSLRPDHLQKMYSDLLSTGLSKASVRKVHSVLRRALSVALKWGLVGRNVALSVSPPSLDPYDIKPLTVEDAKKFLKVLEGDRLYAFYVVLITLGVRRGEALGILKENLDLEKGIVTIKHSLSFIPGKGLVLGETKSNKSHRVLKLPEFTVKVLKDHLAIYSKYSKYVFSTGNGTPFSPRNIHRHFKLKLAEAGLPDTTRIHDIRHSHISWLIRSGQDIKSVSAVAGHAQTSTTLQLYSHLMPGYNQEVADKVQGMFND